jgi:hypothetical protein
LADGIPKKGILMAYISRSCDQITKKENIKRLYKQLFDATNTKKSQKNSENYLKNYIQSNKHRMG